MEVKLEVEFKMKDIEFIRRLWFSLINLETILCHKFMSVKGAQTCKFKPYSSYNGLKLILSTIKTDTIAVLPRYQFALDF